MNEMTPAERVALDTLRATALAKMSDADFANLETEVASKGLRNLDGWFGAQVAKAVLEKGKQNRDRQGRFASGGGGSSSSSPASPAGGKGGGGQKSQSERGANNVRTAKDKLSAHKEIESITSDLAFARSNGDKEVVDMLEERRAGARQAYRERFGESHKAGVEPSSDIAGRANTRREDEAADKVGYGANQTAENMTAHSNEMNQKIYGKDGASKKMTPIDEVELMGINDSLSSAAESLTMLSSGKPQKQHDQIISVRRQLRETRGDAVRQLSPAVRNIAVRAIDKHVAEVDDLLSLAREAWTGVGGTFE